VKLTNKLTNMQIDLELIRKFNGDDLLSKVFYILGSRGNTVPEVVPFKKTATEYYTRMRACAPDDSRVYYITQEIGYPEVTLVGDRDDD